MHLWAQFYDNSLFSISTYKFRSYIRVMISGLETGTVQLLLAAALVSSAQSNGKENKKIPPIVRM